MRVTPRENYEGFEWVQGEGDGYRDVQWARILQGLRGLRDVLAWPPVTVLSGAGRCRCEML